MENDPKGEADGTTIHVRPIYSGEGKGVDLPVDVARAVKEVYESSGADPEDPYLIFTSKALPCRLQ